MGSGDAVRVYADLDLAAFDADGLLFGGGLGQAGFDGAEGNAVDVDVQATPLLGHGLGQAHDPGLGGGVVDLAGSTTGARHGGDVDDLAVDDFTGFGFGLAGFAEIRVGGFQQQERCFQVAVDDGVPLLFGHLLDHVIPGETGVVDDDVDAAEGVQGGLHATVAEVGGGHVTDAGDCIAAEGADFRDHFIGRSLVEVVDHDLGAFFGKFQRDGAADAAAGTGNDGDFAL
ncbi:hypothetical protein D9M71_402850 [compost metagenome]